MKLINQVLENVDENDWNNNLQNYKFSTVFQTAGFNKPFQFAHDSKLFFIQILKTDNEIVGQLTVMLDLQNYSMDGNFLSKSIINKFNLGSTLTWKHGPLIYDESNKQQILEEIIKSVDKIAKENNIETIRGTSSPLTDYPSESVFTKYQYECKPWKTFIINLKQNPTDYFLSLDKSIKYDIRNAEKKNIKFSIAKNLEDFLEYGKYRLKKRNENPEKILQKGKIGIEYTWNHIFQKGFRTLFMAKLNDEIIGGIETANFNKNVSQISILNRPELDPHAGSFLTWKTINWFMENNFSMYDMGGVNPMPDTKKEKGIDFYKSKWYGQEFKYFYFTKINKKSRKKIGSLLRNPRLVSKKFGKLIQHN